MSTDEPRAGLSVDERLALVDAAERREASAVRKAAAVAWIFVAVAALLLGLVVFGGWWQVRHIRAEVATLDDQREKLVARIDAQKEEVARLDAEYRDKQAALSTLIGAVRRTDQSARGGLETALDADPTATTLVPRAYIQIVDAGDRQWAMNLSDRLQHAGVIPVGIELVTSAAALRQFEVRYYKKAEEPGAQRIVGVMERSGVPANPVYLNLENNTRVRRNHFEIWCPANARQHKLRAITP